MKKIFIPFFCMLAMIFASCERFLDTENYTQKNTSNYPKTLADAKQVVTGIYNNLSVVNANPQFSFFMAAQLAGDDRLGGGGANDQILQATDLLMNYTPATRSRFWSDRYAGIQRANTAIATLPDCEGFDSDEQKNQMIGEAFFLRAFYYYELASMFENIPLFTEPVAANLPQASPDEVWGRICLDLKTAAGLMASRKTSPSEAGHADKYTAEAMLARAFLFYTGFYRKSEVLLSDGTALTKSEVISAIDDCVNNSGYSLVSDFRNLWAYTNRLTVNDYNYTKGVAGVNGLPLSYAENDQAINPESMFAIKYSKLADWETTIGYSNGFALFFGVRGGQAQENTFPFGQGWGAGMVSPGLWNEWKASEPNDLRREASICDVRAELDPYGYQTGAAGWADFIQETDYLDKKLSPVSSRKSDGTGYTETFEQEMYSYASVNFQLSNIHDLILIRFADVLLMQAELKEDAAPINRVRARAGLPPLSGYSLPALQNERRWELANEGVRWNDIRRWHIAEDALEKQTNVKIYISGKADVNKSWGGGYKARYRATRGFFPIPEEEIALSEGVYKQNEGWTGADYSSWK
ncbi:MAG: RagB/SusD family nutrient uptake outer membrane protein [Prevotellaceae bacterium]|jgi:phosphopantetheine adenylyltransferase|nr:RagB/SusD family nutrient uptake outer membrane protein [Prevotellaceae bacterium]